MFLCRNERQDKTLIRAVTCRDLVGSLFLNSEVIYCVAFSPEKFVAPKKGAVVSFIVVIDYYLLCAIYYFEGMMPIVLVV